MNFLKSCANCSGSYKTDGIRDGHIYKCYSGRNYDFDRWGYVDIGNTCPVFELKPEYAAEGNLEEVEA